MTRFVLRRLVGLVPLLLVLSVAVFLLVYLIPGDPAVTLAGGEAATPERVAEVREQLGFDEPVVVQYGWTGSPAPSGSISASRSTPAGRSATSCGPGCP